MLRISSCDSSRNFWICLFLMSMGSAGFFDFVSDGWSWKLTSEELLLVSVAMWQTAFHGWLVRRERSALKNVHKNRVFFSADL